MEKWIGKSAPKFTLPDQNGQRVALRDVIDNGKMTVLFFYPKDLTSGCTIEAKEFSDLKKKFSARGVKIYGVSRDEIARHQKFIEKESLTVDLLSDPEAKVLEKYDVWKEKSLYGRKYMGIMRETFVINAKGKVVAHWEKVKPAGHAQEVLDAIIEYKKNNK